MPTVDTINPFNVPIRVDTTRVIKGQAVTYSFSHMLICTSTNNIYNVIIEPIDRSIFQQDNKCHTEEVILNIEPDGAMKISY